MPAKKKTTRASSPDPAKAARLARRGALRRLTLVLGLAALGGWMLWRAYETAPNTPPPATPFYLLALAVLALSLDFDWRAQWKALRERAAAAFRRPASRQPQASVKPAAVAIKPKMTVAPARAKPAPLRREGPEPSVLDYLKSGQIFRRRAEEAAPLRPAAQTAVAQKAIAKADSRSVFARLPWLAMVTLAFGLAGQLFFEPPRESAAPGIFLYIITAALLVYAQLRGDWPLPEPRPTRPWTAPWTLRPLPLAAGVTLLLVAFLSFGGNLFTVFNVTVWTAGTALILLAFWRWNPGGPPWRERLKAVLGKREGSLRVSRWTVAVLLAFGVAAFFRFYQLADVPPEMTSDHAEKLLDVMDAVNGQPSIFFLRNTGREAMQFYMTAVTIGALNTGFTFLSLKIGTALAGFLMLIYVYLLGKELGNKRVGLFAAFLCGVAYWPNVQARMGLRFILYAAFVAPMLYHLIRGLRTANRNHFILSGLFLGMGLHGHSSYRIVPFLAVLAVVLFLVHAQSKGVRREAIIGLLVLAFFALAAFLPLLRFMTQSFDMYSYRAYSRLGLVENQVQGSAAGVFALNLWNGLKMMNYDDGEIWINSIPHRPALDAVSASLFLMGVILLVFRYLQRRDWRDAALLLAVPLLLMPSILSLTFPNENPSPNRAVGAVVPVFLIAALALDGLWAGFKQKIGRGAAWGIVFVLLAAAAARNYDLVFNEYNTQYRNGTWNASEVGAVIAEFAQTIGTRDSAWVVAYPHWVDNRLVGFYAGFPGKDYEMWPDRLPATLTVPAPKLFLLKPEDTAGLDALKELYPQGVTSMYDSRLEFRDFILFYVLTD